MTRRGWLILLLLPFLAWLCTGVFQVNPGEQAVVRRFGALAGPPRGPGLHFGLPWGLDRVDRVAVDTQRELRVGGVTEDIVGSTGRSMEALLTGDNNLLDLQLTVFYRVDPQAVVAYVLHRDRVEPVLARLTEEATLFAVASERIDPLLLGQARQLEQRVKQSLLRQLAAQRLGVVVDQVTVNRAEPPGELVETFREVNRARTRRDTIEREAMSLRNTEVSLARQHSDRVRAEAATRAEQLRTAAAAESESFTKMLASLPTNPAQRRQALLEIYLSRMKEVLGKMQVRTITGANAEQHVILPASRDR